VKRCNFVRAILGNLTVGSSILISATAFAQSNVTMYGIIDGGVAYITNAAKVGGQNRSVTQMISGGEANDRFGFKGSEDLGGGMKAISSSRMDSVLQTARFSREAACSVGKRSSDWSRRSER
jgi:predicted porin